MNKNKSKYFNTAVKMDQALVLLLEKKDFEYITIKEICQTAGVNRSTFYLHYDNTADLLKETTQYITDSFFSYFSKDMQSAAYKIESCNLNDLMFISPEYLTPYFTFIKENQRVFLTSLKQFDSMCFKNVFDNLFKGIFNPVLIRFGVPEKERIYILKFYLMGITAIVMEWLENSCADSIEFISRLVIDCIIGKLNPT